MRISVELKLYVCHPSVVMVVVVPYASHPSCFDYYSISSKRERKHCLFDYVIQPSKQNSTEQNNT